MNQSTLILWMVVLALGGAATVEWIKQITWPLRPGIKSLLTLMWAGGWGAWLGGTDKERVLLIVGIFGIAPLAHAVEAALRLIRDNAKQQVVQRARTARGTVDPSLLPSRVNSTTRRT